MLGIFPDMETLTIHQVAEHQALGGGDGLPGVSANRDSSLTDSTSY